MYTGVYRGEEVLSRNSTSWLGAPFSVASMAPTLSIISIAEIMPITRDTESTTAAQR